MMRFGILIMMVVAMQGCNKYQLLPDELIGEWEWSYSTILLPQYDRYGNFTHFVNSGDTIFPGSVKYDADFNASFLIKHSGAIHLFKDEFNYMKIKANEMRYDYDESHDVVYYDYVKGDYFEDVGEYSRLNLRCNGSFNFLSCNGFPIDGGGNSGNQVSIIHKNSKVVVHNIFTKK